MAPEEPVKPEVLLPAPRRPRRRAQQRYKGFPCPNCSSIQTRLSRSRAGILSVFLKGTLYRCRNCKTHFRVRDAHTTGVVAGIAATVTFFVLLAAIVINAFSGHPGKPSGPGLMATVMNRISMGFGPDRTPEIQVTTQQLLSLYADAASYERSLPDVEAVYVNAVARYKAQMGELSRMGKADRPEGRTQHDEIVARAVRNLEGQHKLTLEALNTFRGRLDPMLTEAGQTEKYCTQGKSNRANSQTLACAKFGNELSLFKTKAEVVLKGFDRLEQVYQDSQKAVEAGRSDVVQVAPAATPAK